MAFDPVGDTINKTESAGEHFTDHAADRIEQQVRGILPALEGYDLVIRISLEKKG